MAKQIFKFPHQTKRAILQRDGHRCQLCYAMGHEAHHAFFGAKRPKGFDHKKHNVSKMWNGATLCRDCHYGIHHAPDQPNGKTRKFNVEFLQDIAQGRFDETNNPN